VKRVRSLTEQKIFELLKRRWPWPAYVMLPQVGNSTGFACRRYADAVVVSTYPSRGIYAIGVEIKTSRSDWRKELAEPEKAEAVLKYCLYWYVVAPKGLLNPAEIPEQWGLIECDSRSTRIIKRAPKLKPVAPTWEFMAAVTRRLAEHVITMEEHERLLQEERERSAEDAKKAMELRIVQHELNELKEAVARFERASGINISDRWRLGQIGEAVNLIVRARREGGYDREIDRVIGTLHSAIQSLESTRDVLKQLDAECKGDL